MKKSFAVFCVLWVACSFATAEIRLPRFFSSNMVLQRDKPVSVWGWTNAGQAVRVRFSGQSRTAKADANGKWTVTLDAMKADSTPQSLTISAGNDKATLTDVLVGDIWICSGQSNMEFRMRNSRDADVELPCARYKGIRFLHVIPTSREEPQADFPDNEAGPAGQWQPCTPETIGQCSAVGYYFALRLHRRLDVPVGIVSSAWGGTMAQHWVTRKTLETIDEAKPYIEEFDKKLSEWKDAGGEAGAATRYQADLKKWEADVKTAKTEGKRLPRRPSSRNYANPAHGRCPAGPLNAMIMPMAGLSIKGVLFYQGENNSFGDTWIPFRKTFPAVIADWRKIFCDDKLPFGIIQIAGWSNRRSMTYDMNHHTNAVREMQFNTWRATPDTGLIVTFDLNSNGSIHPGRKYPVGQRCARWALSTVYDIADAAGRGPVKWHGPIYKSMEIVGKRIRVSFETDGAAGLRLNKDDARGFYIAGSDRVFHNAQARIVSDKGKTPAVEVWCDEVAKPVAVRYAFSNLPLGTLINGKELPAFPFRTDTWPLKPHYGEALYYVNPKDAQK